MQRYRAGAVFARPSDHCVPIDRNQRARILYLAEALERRTKAPGRRNGVLGYVGLALLRTLLLRFANCRTGACFPSYTAIQCATGLCRQSIALGLARLEAAGVLRIVRRLVRQRVARVSPWTGEPETIVTTTQASNLYAFAEPAAYADHLPVPAARKRAFPRRGRWRCGSDCSPIEPSLAGRV